MMGILRFSGLRDISEEEAAGEMAAAGVADVCAAALPQLSPEWALEAQGLGHGETNKAVGEKRPGSGTGVQGSCF